MRWRIRVLTKAVGPASDLAVSEPLSTRHRLGGMPMRATTVRFSEELWKLLERESSREGVSAAQFIRDATIMRAAYAMGQRGDAGIDEALRRTSEPPDAEAPRNGAERRQALLEAAAVVRDPDRLEALQATGLLDTDVSPSFDRLARVAAHVLNAPVALVSLVDADRQFFKSCLGLPEPWASERGLSAQPLLLSARGREPRAAGRRRRARARAAARQPRDPRHRDRRLRGHPAHRRRRARARHAVRDRQPAPALDDPPGPAAQRPRRLGRHGDRAGQGGEPVERGLAQPGRGRRRRRRAARTPRDGRGCR